MCFSTLQMFGNHTGGQWPPQTGVRPIRQDNTLRIPTPVSPGRESCLWTIPLGGSTARAVPAPQSPPTHSGGLFFPCTRSSRPRTRDATA